MTRRISEEFGSFELCPEYKNLLEQVTCCQGFHRADRRNCSSANNLFPKTEKNGDTAVSENNVESCF